MAKTSKDGAQYIVYTPKKEKCKACSMFRSPASCTLVKGIISPQGHCKYWEKKQLSALRAVKELKLS